MSTPAWSPSRKHKLRDGLEVAVREMDWHNALEFMALLAGQATSVGTILSATQRADGAQASHAQMAADVAQVLPGLITGATELMDHLLRHAVVEPQQLAGRGLADVLPVVSLAIEVNLSAEVLEAAGALGKTLGVALSATLKSPPPRS